MANIVNIDAETGANMIGDDSSPTLSLSNSSTGPALQVTSFVATSTATLASAAITGGSAILSTSPLVANATLGQPLALTGVSVASGAVIRLINRTSYASCTTIDISVAAANTCGAIRVVRPNGTFGWIPVFPDSAVTGTAV